MSTATNTQAVPDDLDVMHADQITRIWRECQAQGLDHVAFAWRIEREGWRRLLTALTSAPPAPSVGGWISVDEQLPECDGETVFIGENEAGYIACFTRLTDDGYCFHDTAETSICVMSGLRCWKRVDRPQPPKEKP